MIGLQVPKKFAEQIKQQLLKKNVINPDYEVDTTTDHVLFPLIKPVLIDQTDLIEHEFQKKEHPQTIETQLQHILTPQDLAVLPRSYDIIGTIAIIDLPDQLIKQKKAIGQALLSVYPQIKTVVLKRGNHEGEFRLQKTEHVAGINTKETTHKESGVLLMLDIDEVYFSPRLSHERLRVASQVQKGESVLVLFSGCAPYPLVIAQNAQPKIIIGIEKNPTAHKYAMDNIEKNKTTSIHLHHGDVQNIVPELHQTFDRIIMPLPKGAEDFLSCALQVCHEGTRIHFYDFSQLKDFPGLSIEKIQQKLSEEGWQCTINDSFLCGQYAPYTYRVCIDFIVHKNQQ